MAVEELVMPKMGESITEATVLKWLKNVGDSIEMDETLLEIATDKVDSEVPSTVSGTVSEILFNVDDVVPVGTVIAKISTGGEAIPSASASEPNAETPVAEATPAPVVTTAPATANPAPNTATNAGEPNRFYSPLVMNIAAKEGISMSELESIAGSGKEGRVTKKDIIGYVKSRGDISQATTAPAKSYTNTPAPQGPAVTASDVNETAGVTTANGNVEIIEMDRMRKLIAKHMVDSVHTSPHVTSMTEADVTNMVNWRNRVKGEFLEKNGEKLTFTPLFIEAIVNCIKRNPMINASVDGDNIIIKKDINIGMATALPSGNLIVPVIKNADTKNLYGISKEVNGLANAARTNKLKPEDTQGGTFTLTNVGTFGSLMGTPIISQPQVAILAVGTIKKRPVVMETAEGDVIAIRQMMYLSMSYDHRIVDGSLGAGFLSEVAKELENFDVNRTV
jgi:2-oxoglutarate dehydrogenase E2 component (dihydrolipoamide succinyltransferase)